MSSGLVNIEDNCTVADVKDEIVKKMPRIFSANELILWKVSIRMTRDLKASVKEHQLLNDTFLMQGDSLSEIFSLPLRRPCISLHKYDRDVKGSFVEELAHLRTHFWGQNRAVSRQSPTAEIIDLSSVSLSRLNPLSVKTLLVRKEYRIAYDTIIADITKHAGRRSIILMTGQPGIGKTFFLLYFLFRRLQEREPVALQINAEQFVIFDQYGVHLCLIHAEETFSIPKGIWTLSYSSSEQLGPCTAFQTSATHLLHTSSPSSDRWKDWVKQLSAKRYIMDVWSPAGFQTLLAVSNLDIGRGLTLFHQYGSNVRTIVAIAGGHIPQPCPSSGRQNCTRILDNRDISGTPRSGFLFQGRFLSIYAQTQGFGLATTCFDHPDYISPHAVVRKLNNMRSSQYSTPIPLFAAPPGGCSKI